MGSYAKRDSSVVCVPIGVGRPLAALQACGFFPLPHACRADAARVEGIPEMPAGAGPPIVLVRSPAAFGAADARSGRAASGTGVDKFADVGFGRFDGGCLGWWGWVVNGHEFSLCKRLCDLKEVVRRRTVSSRFKLYQFFRRKPVLTRQLKRNHNNWLFAPRTRRIA